MAARLPNNITEQCVSLLKCIHDHRPCNYVITYEITEIIYVVHPVCTYIDFSQNNIIVSVKPNRQGPEYETLY